MALFNVTEILSGNRIRVTGWNWSTHSGTDVIIAGYNPTQGAQAIAKLNEDLAKARLTSLINGKDVELGKVYHVNSEGSITCLVFYNGVDVAKYFPEYTQTQHY